MNKTYIYRMMAVCTALAAMHSCNFLDEQPTSFVGSEDYFQSTEQCRTAVNSTYTTLRSVFGSTLFTHLEGTTDLMRVPSVSDVNAIMDLSPAHCNVSTNVWNNGYKSIMYANYAIAGMEKSPIDPKDKNPLIAEAKIMRAFWYYMLTSCFGDVPFYTQDVSDTQVLNQVATLPRMSAVATRAALIDELKGCLGYLPKIRTNDMSEEESGRAGWAVGMMLIGKMALWNSYMDKESDTDWWQVAIDALTQLEGVYKDLADYPLEDLYFRVPNTKERIFEIQHRYTEGALSYAGSIATNCMPSYNATTELFDGVSVPELGTEMKVGTCNRPNAYFYAGLQPNKGIDLRTHINCARSYNGQNFTNGAKIPWLGPKFWCPYMKQTYDTNNYPIFRYADALLMLAEAYAGKENQEQFLHYINMTRTRAGLPAYTFSNWVKANQEVRDERARELFGEFQRKFDLVRWGIWYEAVKEYTEQEQLRANIRPCHRYFPIQDKQIIYSGYALDNNEYNQYGL